jgi:hypothetical protein
MLRFCALCVFGVPSAVPPWSGWQGSGLEERATRRAGHRLSPRIQKRMKQISGGTKKVGALRLSENWGRKRTQARPYVVVGAYNLLRKARQSFAGAG